jgi:hypothetical protein
MGLYDERYGTDWDALDKDEATERAYALGVAESLGQYDRDEFEAIHDAMDTAYQRSMVELAFREGKNEAQDVRPAVDDENEESAVWTELVEGKTVVVDEDDLPTGGRDGLPDAIDGMDALDRPDPSDVDATDRPDFLDR